jgi:maltose-binding protein MalE
MYSKSKNKSAAWWLLKYLTLGGSTKLLAQFGIAIPGDVSAAHSSTFNNEYKPYTSTWLAGQKRGQALRVVPNEDKWWDAINSALTDYWNSASASVNAATSKACAAASPNLP